MFSMLHMLKRANISRWIFSTPQGEAKNLVKFSSGVKEHIPARRVDCATKPGNTVNEDLVAWC